MATNAKLSLPETESQNSNKSASPKDDICRDYLRNVCHRGAGCKYRHPDQNEAVSLGKSESVEFCHDYQNGQCLRRNCKFIHCTKDEEEYYRCSGHLNSQTPICKDFLNGKCHRSSRCKFQHVPPAGIPPEPPYDNSMPSQYNSYDEGLEPHVKRRAMNVDYRNHYERPPVMPEYYLRLEEENRMLADKVDQLQKQVADLTSTNEFLLEQNAKLHVASKQPSMVPPVQRPSWPAAPKPVNNGISGQGVYGW